MAIVESTHHKLVLRRVAEKAYDEWAESPGGFRLQMSRKDCVDFWEAAFLAGTQLAPRDFELLEEADNLLLRVEDTVKGESGDLITKTRGLIGQFIKQNV